MSQLPEPFVDLVLNGVNVSNTFSSSMLDFQWTDNLHGKADEIAFGLLDDKGLWRGAWRPDLGDEAVASIGYVGGLVMQCGSFQIDIPRASGSRAKEVVKFKATSVFPEKDQRTQKSEALEKTDLNKVIRHVAKRLGYGVSGNIDAVPFQYKRQRRMRDLAYIKRLAEDYGHFVSAKDKQLVFYQREELEQQGPVRVFEIAPGSNLINWSAQETSDKTYKKAQVSYLDPQAKKLIKGEVQDLSSKSGDILTIDERVENEEQAQKLAKGRLAKANEDKRTASLTVVGDPLLIAGQVVELGRSFGQYAGRYLIHKAVHVIKRANYTTKLELKGV